MKNEVKLSVIIISYKQEKYIREAIDSVLSQNVNFKYELLLADDCSPDNTKNILLEYENKYPDIIKVLDRKKNLGASNNLLDAVKFSKGKYITFLEGDDYWCDNNKIQTQVDFLEQNREFIAVSHLQEGRNLKGVIQGYFPKNIRKDIIIDGIEDLIQNNKKFSSSATLYRNIYLDSVKYDEIKEILSYDSIIGDAQMCIYLSNIGKIYVMNKPMMVYRMRHNDGDSNFNSSHKVNEIEYRCMNIYIKLEKFYKDKYSFYETIKNNYAIGVMYDLLKLNFKDIIKFNKLCPKKYKWRIYLLFPFTCIKIIFDRFIKK